MLKFLLTSATESTASETINTIRSGLKIDDTNISNASLILESINSSFMMRPFVASDFLKEISKTKGPLCVLDLWMLLMCHADANLRKKVFNILSSQVKDGNVSPLVLSGSIQGFASALSNLMYIYIYIYVL